MKLFYENAETEIVRFTSHDVIRTSEGCVGDGYCGGHCEDDMS